MTRQFEALSEDRKNDNKNLVESLSIPQWMASFGTFGVYFECGSEDGIIGKTEAGATQAGLSTRCYARPKTTFLQCEDE